MHRQPIESSWVQASLRYDDLKEFVRSSAASAPRGDLEYRRNLYSGWVLLTYAATEAALNDQGTACLAILGRIATVPSDLPKNLVKQHRRRTLSFLATQANDGKEDEKFEIALTALDSTEWYKHSKLLHLERNVWPQAIREWLDRLSVPKERIGWMNQSSSVEPETLASRLNGLVTERNAIAHGEKPATLLDIELMRQWIDDSRAFVEGVVRTLQGHLVDLFPNLEIIAIGEMDRAVKLGKCSIALRRSSIDLVVGGHICLRSDGSTARIARITSMMSGSLSLTHASAGQSELAITLSKPVAGSTAYSVL